MRRPLRASDWHGRHRAYVRVADGAVGQSLRGFVDADARRHGLLPLDPVGIQTAWGLAHAHERTVLTTLRRGPPAGPPSASGIPREPMMWAQALEASVRRIAATARAPALALGGGVDAAAVLAAWRNTGMQMPCVLTIHTGLPEYDELEEARTIASAFDVPVHPVSVTTAELIAHLPEAIAVAETPLYNLHPVSRFVLARAAKAQGFQTLVTGDGADAAFRGRADLDYVPILADLTETVGLDLLSPFFEDELLAATVALGPDPEKRPLRAYLRTHLPMELPKRPRWMPPLDLAPHLSSRMVRRLETALSLRADLATDRGRVGWATLGLLVRALEGDA